AVYDFALSIHDGDFLLLSLAAGGLCGLLHVHLIGKVEEVHLFEGFDVCISSRNSLHLDDYFIKVSSAVSKAELYCSCRLDNGFSGGEICKRVRLQSCVTRYLGNQFIPDTVEK